MRLLPAFVNHAEVTLWTDEPTWDRQLERSFEIRRYRPSRLPLVQLNRADLNVYNIGNNPHFHGGIWQVSRTLPGIVVLHDFRLHHFFDGIFRVKLRDLNSYLTVMKKYYGEEARRDAEICFRQDARNIDQMAELYPLTDLALENALAVIVHTQEAFKRLSQNSPRPIALAPLPFPAREFAATRGQRATPFRLIVFGYIGRNRRLESIVRALACSEYKEQYQLDVFGSILDDEKQLRALITSLGLNNRVKLHGYKTEFELDEALSRADLAINLRYPSMGEASGSQLRIWSHALPALVSKVGWYEELPVETVGFVRPGQPEVEDIQNHLEAFVKRPEFYAGMGERGRRILREKHSPESYAATVLELARNVQVFRAHHAGLRLAERAARAASQFIGPSLMNDSFQRVATEIHSLVEAQDADRN